MKKALQKGFTLVELAIVLVIIGLVVSGVLVGGSLMDSAKTLNLISDTKKFKQQVEEFYGRYQSLPGDMYNAKYSEDFKMGVWESAIANGNGNGRIEQEDIDGTNEEVLAWQHLALSGILNANVTGEFSGGYIVDENILQGGVDDSGYVLTSKLIGEEEAGRKTYLRIGSTGLDGENEFYEGPALTLSKALELDDKFDDGIATGGTIKMLGDECNDLDADDGSDYAFLSDDSNADDPVCTGYFLVR